MADQLTAQKDHKDDDREKEIIKKLLTMAQDAEDEHMFTKDDLKTLKKMAQVYQGLESLGKFAEIVKKLLAVLGWLGALWIAYKTGGSFDWNKILFK